MRMLARIGTNTSTVLALVIAANCTEPVPPVAIYDLATQLDTFSFETGGPSVPDCPYQYTIYCTHIRGFSGATLTGTLTLVDHWHLETTPVAGTTEVANVTGSFGGQFCDAIDYSALSGCLHVAPISLAPYVGTLTHHRSQPDSSFSFEIDQGPLNEYGVGFGRVVAGSGTMAGDSLYGRVYWYFGMFARSPPTHSGRFVAHRRK
jgi:hypothetical protein